MGNLAGFEQQAGWRAVMADMVVGVRDAILRFPVATLFLSVAALKANFDIAGIDLFGAQSHWWEDPELEVGLVSGGLAALALALSSEARGCSPVVKLAAALVAAFVGFIIIGWPDRFDVLLWPAVPLGLAGLVLVAPFLGRGDSGSFWMFSARAAFAMLLGLFSLLLLAGGLTAILASLSYLFGLEVPDDLYAHVWITTSMFAAPLFAMGQLPRVFDEQPNRAVRGFMDRGMRALGDFLAAPLLIVYAVILHLYALKIAVTGEVPEGRIGWLVLTYGFCVFGSLLIINPFFDRSRPPTRLFLRFWPFFLPIPLVLLFYALAKRVGEFGFTPERYLLGLFGLVTVIVLAFQLFSRLRGDIRLVAAVPVLALLLASFGPQGAVAVSINSQAERFLQLVQEQPVEEDRHGQALSALGFLRQENALRRVAPEGIDVPAEPSEAYRVVAKAWKLDPDRYYAGENQFSINRNLKPTAYEVGDYTTFITNVQLSADSEDPVSVDLPSGTKLGLALESGAIKVTNQGQMTLLKLPKSLDTLTSNPDKEGPIEIDLEGDGRSIKIMVNYLTIDMEDTPRLQYLDGTILLNEGEWG